MPAPESEPVVPPGCPAHFGMAVPGPAAGGLEAGGYPLHIPEFIADPWIVYQELREQGPLAPVELAPGVRAWLVLDYAAALEVLREPGTFSADPRRWRALRGGGVPPDGILLPLLRWQPFALFADGDEHHRLRQVVVDSLARIDPHTLRNQVGKHADRLIDQFAAEGGADLIGQYTQPLLAHVLSDLCGAPLSLGEQVLAALTRTVEGPGVRTALTEMAGHTAELVALKQGQPGPDVTSWMLTHTAGLDNDETIGMLVQFIAYGGSTLRLLIANGLRLLLSDDRLADGLAGGSLLIDDALDEVLWNDPPLANFAPHFPVRDTEFHGVVLREGDPVLISIAGIATDPSVAVGSRAGNRGHLAWGTGAHACPAQGQARVIAAVAMEKLLDRLPEVELAVPADKLKWHVGPVYRALAALPVRFPPAALSDPTAEPATAVPDTAGADAFRHKTSALSGSALHRAGNRLGGWWRGQ